MATRSRGKNFPTQFHEDTTFETVDVMAAMFFQEDFVGAGHGAGVPAAGAPVAGYPWVKKIVGAAPPTVGLVANGSGGLMACTLTSTSEKQDAALYFNDNLAIDVTKAANFEAVAALSVLPSAASVQMVMGLSSAWVDGPDNATRYLEFGCTANGALLIRSKDGTTTNSFAAAKIGGAAITLDTAYHTFRINADNPNDVVFYLDGDRVNAVGSVAFVATGANAILQPYLAVYKPSGTGVATLTVDKVDLWANR